MSDQPRAERICDKPTPDRSGRSCDKPHGHDGPHWTYGGRTLTWQEDGTIIPPRAERTTDRDAAGRCGMAHATLDAACQLAAGHTENHYAGFAHGSVQWPRASSPPEAAAPFPQADMTRLCACGHTADEHGNGGVGHCGATKACRAKDGCKFFRDAQPEAAAPSSEGLAALIAMWRRRGDTLETVHRDTGLPRRERNEMAGESRTFWLCANELEAALRQSPTKEPTNG